ncbi:aminotransferase class I/II-fold pyridoxal phosphate-dependent enzyme [Streptomyces sp. B1866]|uniref:aminotransferase class I/II-fold pyridoxal phosphate-dependent enzyme n=1 Tax=Streptomyces sp. B1866 TaxID=3075431 RepID=UPI00288CB3DA|nr:aminotransferase class I/II-fold pyridoxal phosphate-dependent enzyme [Streptomyces sp. B1866]MDT3397228.1 aminotransferase class I/II-fold pyridoxal phosphate-dependent enzyme [Streptomyces sp. B1866]
MVSRSAARLAAQAPAIAVAHFRAEEYPYHPRQRPDGYFNLGTAENRLVWDLLEPRLAGRPPLTAADTRYAPLHGTPALREAIAGFLSGVCRRQVRADELVVVSGATGALDIAASALCDPGDAIVLPAPYYGAFDVDLAGRSGARLVRAPLAAGDGFRLDPEAVDQALTRARWDGFPVRAVALASPGNPVGHVHPARTLKDLGEVAARHGVGIIADEIYAGSVFGPEPFVSLLGPEAGLARAPGAHMVWGFAKDFGLPGFKVGVLYSPDPEVCAAARALAYFAPCSTETQALLTGLLADTAWVDRFTAESRRRLAVAYERATRLLDALGIGYVPVGAGFSLWVDLRRWLPAPTFPAEHELWAGIFEGARVNILPGKVFACPEPGWFRLCFTTDWDTVREGVVRLDRFLRAEAARRSAGDGDPAGGRGPARRPPGVPEPGTPQPGTPEPGVPSGPSAPSSPSGPARGARTAP